MPGHFTAILLVSGHLKRWHPVWCNNHYDLALGWWIHPGTGHVPQRRANSPMVPGFCLLFSGLRALFLIQYCSKLDVYLTLRHVVSLLGAVPLPPPRFQASSEAETCFVCMGGGDSHCRMAVTASVITHRSKCRLIMTTQWGNISPGLKVSYFLGCLGVVNRAGIHMIESCYRWTTANT